MPLLASIHELRQVTQARELSADILQPTYTAGMSQKNRSNLSRHTGTLRMADVLMPREQTLSCQQVFALFLDRMTV